MRLLQNEQLYLLNQKMNEMLTMLNTYDTFETAKFRPALQMISNNIEQCIRNSFDGIEELSGYILEDWRTVCLGKSGMENWYLSISDVTQKGEQNKAFEEAALSVERILGTNFLVPRTWYSYNELVTLGQKYKETEKNWNAVIEELEIYATDERAGKIAGSEVVFEVENDAEAAAEYTEHIDEFV